jgi:hypothetical protein
MIKMDKSTEFQNYRSCASTGNQNYVISGKNTLRKFSGPWFQYNGHTSMSSMSGYTSNKIYFYDLSTIFSFNDDVQNMKRVFWNIAITDIEC